MHRYRILGMLLLSTFVAIASAHDAHGDDAQLASAPVPLFDGLGDHTMPITIESEEARRYFDQGLMFVFGFDHFEAARSFEAAIALDETCAMCHWGLALALGPHINGPMAPDAVPTAYAASQRALALAAHASDWERAYIEALTERYAPEALEDRTHLDRAYADAMRDVVAAHPDDLDAATLFAEALMNVIPWNYWDASGEPRPETVEIVATLESVLERDPYHPGANHHYIHAVEASPTPERAEGAADRLVELDIPIGHMIHMPSHIYARVGRWHDASSANERAVVADRAYLEAYEAEGLVPVLYHPHNLHFLAWTAGVEGRSALALQASADVAAAIPPELAADLPFLNAFLIAPYLTMVRFEMWDEILAGADAVEDPHAFVTATRHYALGRAHAALGQAEAATAEAEALRAIADSEEAQGWAMPEAFFPGRSQLSIMQDVLHADLAMLDGDLDEAVRLLERAVAAQDALPYMEPPYWSNSSRLDLGRVLIAAGRHDDATRVFQDDLEAYPDNGWALFGLAEALAASDDTAAAEVTRERFEAAWSHADVTLQSGDAGIEVVAEATD
jgi:tetratricopeptide (TPR) repeat protein